MTAAGRNAYAAHISALRDIAGTEIDLAAPPRSDADGSLERLAANGDLALAQGGRARRAPHSPARARPFC